MPQHTDKAYEEELAQLRAHVLEMGGLVEEQIAHAIRALTERDESLARETMQRDHTVNRLDVEIDELCIKLLALRQPAARDLRLITTALKITTDLERIGDLASHTAERALEHQSLDAFVKEDAELALAVCASDDPLDKLHAQLFRELLSFMVEDPTTISRAMRLLFVSKALERIGDHATNIAEMVIFMVRGRSIRHMDAVPRVL